MATSKPKLSTTFQLPVDDEVEEAYDDEPEFEPVVKRKGRPTDTNRLPWEEARAFVHSQFISSRKQYEKWFEREKPKTLPRFPYRVYKEWTSWNDFLGNENKFNEKIGTRWRPLLDAIPFVHALKLSSQAEWLEYYRLNKEESDFPTDIPARPDLVYAEWRGWSHFLGNKPIQAIEARKEAERVQIYSIVHYPSDPQNVLYYAVDPNPTTFKERYEDQGFNIVKTYWFNREHAQRIDQIVDEFSSQYMDSRRQRITPNVYDIIWHLDHLLDPVLRGQV